MKGKLVASVEEAIRLCGLKDGMTVSFHHHLRDGDGVLPMVMNKISEMGFHDITVSASGIHGSHGCLVDLIKNGVVTGIDTDYISKVVGLSISHGSMDRPVIFRTHGNRPHAIAVGESPIDIAFIAASAADCQGNMNGVSGPSAFGSMGYAFADAAYAKKVVVITDNLVEYPLTPISIDERYADYVVAVDSIGDVNGIRSGITAVTQNPMSLEIAKKAVSVFENSGLFEEGFIYQTGGGSISLATTKFLQAAMDRKGIRGSAILGGTNGLLVDLLEKGYFRKIMDIQCLDLDAVESIKRNQEHQEISAACYADMLSKSCVAKHLTCVMLGATEIDLDFNVNVHTDSNGIIRGGSGGHTDIAHGAKLTIAMAPLLRQRRSAVLEHVTTKSTLGDSIDVFVTQRGIAVNPKRPDLRSRLVDAGLPVKEIGELYETARALAGKPDPLPFTDKVVGKVYGYDGQLSDVIRQVDESKAAV